MGLYKRGDVWYIRLKHDGKLIRQAVGTDKKLADVALKKKQQEISAAKAAGKEWTGLKEIVAARKPKTFQQAADDYLAERAHFKTSSLKSYTAILRSRLLPVFGACALSDITSSDLRKYQASLMKEGMSPSRTNTIMQLLRSIMKQEADEGLLKHDPTRSVKRVEEPKAEIDPLSQEELDLALAAIRPHFRPLFTCLAYTGARPNELLALRWSDIDWKQETITISKGRVRGAEGTPKTKSSGRVLPMPEIVVDALKEVRQRDVQALSDHVFLNNRGKPIDKNLDLVWRRALARAGLRHRPSYQLRHTFATQRIMDGFPIPYVAKLLGHSTIDTLVRHYAGWIDNATAEYNERLKSTVGKVQVAQKVTQPQRLSKTKNPKP